MNEDLNNNDNLDDDMVTYEIKDEDKVCMDMIQVVNVTIKEVINVKDIFENDLMVEVI